MQVFFFNFFKKIFEGFQGQDFTCSFKGGLIE